MRALNFPLQIIAGNSQPFGGVNIRIAFYQVSGHLRMNNFRMDHKERLWQKHFDDLIVSSVIMLRKSQRDDDGHCDTKKRKLPSEIALSIDYQPDYRRNREERHKRKTRLQRSEEKSAYSDCSSINNCAQFIW